MSCRELPLAVLPSDLHRAAALQGAESGYGVDLVLLEQLTDARGMLADDLSLATAHRREVNGKVLGANADFGTVQHGLVDFREMQQGLCGDATHVEAGTAEMRILLDHADFEPVLGSSNGRHVPSRPAADDQGIVIHRQKPVYQGYWPHRRPERPHAGRKGFAATEVASFRSRASLQSRQ